MIKNIEKTYNGFIVVECTNKQDYKKLETQWRKLGLKVFREFKVCKRGKYVVNYAPARLGMRLPNYKLIGETLIKI